jgi:hypothetical protein
MAPLPDSLAPLAILGTARLNAAGYFAPLLDSPNEIIRIGAWCALLDRDEVTYAQYPRVVALAAHAGIRRRAYKHFMSFWEYARAAEVAAIETSSEEDAEQEVMRAELDADLAAHIAALRNLYLATGKADHLVAMIGLQEQLAGWRSALPLAVDLVVLNPHDPLAALELLNLVHQSRQVELIDAVVGLFEANNLHQFPALLYGAASKLIKGNPGGCLKALAQLSTARIARPDVAARLRVTAMQLSGEALEKLGDYRKAFAAYREMNALDQGKPINLDDFGRMTREAAALEVPPLPPDPRVNDFVMTGFPRSGTTLLENALAAHPNIETFEEIPSRSSMQIYLDRTLPDLPAGADRVPVYLTARQRYYEEMDRQKRKAGATVFVDKMPMRSAEARFLAKVFPDKRYVFSIRHPFDVVLSCFKQHFKPNIAMEHFRTFENAVKLYDFSLSEWFSVFSMDDPRVHYLRYDTLVTEFEPSVRGVLGFMGLEWDDAVLGFAKVADTRAARTPSYQKVRQGLSIGVQTQWRNYGFLFQSPEAQPLYKWAEFFGYPTE